MIYAKNIAVAYKINHWLQSNLLDNDSVLTDTNTVFEESRFISYVNEDSVGQSGYTDISYRVEVNSPNVLSIFFLTETMGIYPESFPSYFNFNSKTGEILTANDLFTPTGITELRNFLFNERKKRIDRWINGMDSMYYATEGDSILVIEQFTECNDEINEDCLIIKKYGITFWKEYCFPHVVRPYDTNLDINFSYKELEKFLSENGKRLLRQKKE